MVIQKFLLMPEKDGSWHGIKASILGIIYSIFNIIILKSVLVFFTFTHTLYDDTELIIAWLYSVTARNVFKYRVFSAPYFPAFGLNTERCSVSLRIQSERGKIRTRITLNMDTFHAVHGTSCDYYCGEFLVCLS